MSLMDGVFTALEVLNDGFSGHRVSRLEIRERRASWSRLATQLGLAHEVPRLFGSERLHGRVGDVELVVRYNPVGAGEHSELLRRTIEIRGLPLPAELELVRVPFDPDREGALGDRDFDRIIVAPRLDPIWRGRLSARVRDTLEQLLRDSDSRIANGAFSYRCVGNGPGWEATWIAERLELVAQLIVALRALPADPVDALRAVADDEPDRTVRLLAAEALVEVVAEGDRTDIARRALERGVPVFDAMHGGLEARALLRLAALAGDAGVPALVAVARSEQASVAQRRKALQTLGSRSLDERVRETLRPLVTDTISGIRIAARAALGIEAESGSLALADTEGGELTMTTNSGALSEPEGE